MADRLLALQGMPEIYTSSAFLLRARIPITGFKAICIKPAIGALHAGTKHIYCPYCRNWLYSLPKDAHNYVNVHQTMVNDIE
ncbi:hypothetical protein GB927_025125 [Shinella sp. CPCC 100929]|uniref:Uncharacterized protein n=1 Tax=Shinella lacus TaxID=2654216 RepID=A0ABT1RDV0_9HYPH|nr:hypothetical protein [Shinella lacus]MCQ4633347.1 hypothetical protein [Shinella lacus]